MRWFGPVSLAPFRTDDLEREPIPVDQFCAWCYEPIGALDFGFTMPGVSGPHDAQKVQRYPFHWECHARQMIGSVAHIEHRCSCFVEGATCTDPPEMTKREAARAALARFRRSN